MGSEYDGGLQIWRKRLGIWRKADGRRMEAHNILTPSPSLLTLALFGIFGTKLICFTFCEGSPSILHEHKRKYWVFWHESVTDGLMVSVEGLTALATSRGLAVPDPNDSCPHVHPPSSPADNGTNQSLCITFEHFGALYIEYWTELCGHVPLLGTHPSGPMLISELNRDQISLMWDIIYGQININMCRDNICKKNQQKNILSHIFCRFLFGWVWLGGSCGALEWVHVTSSYLSTSPAGKDWIHQNMFHGNHENTEKAARRDAEQRLFCGTAEWSWVN